jgi:hypothetical protein
MEAKEVHSAKVEIIEAWQEYLRSGKNAPRASRMA